MSLACVAVVVCDFLPLSRLSVMLRLESFSDLFQVANFGETTFLFPRR